MTHASQIHALRAPETGRPLGPRADHSRRRIPDPRASAGNQATQRLSHRDELLVQRKGDSCHCGTCDECAQPAIKADGAVAAAPPTVARSALPGGGRPLDPRLAGAMGKRLGHNLDGVRIHDDAEGNRFAAQFGARAVTVGRDVYFARGHYRPGTERGDHDLVHELAHVVQQKDLPAARDLGPGGGVPLDRYRALERAADESADRVLSGGDASLTGGVGHATVQAAGESPALDTSVWAGLFHSYGMLPPTTAPEVLDEIVAKAARKDADWVTDKILEVWVDDDDERAVLDVLWRYARLANPRGGNYLDVLLDAIKSYAYWFDYLVGESIKGNCLDKLFAEMEGGHADELRRLIDNFSLRYAGYRGRGDITRIGGAVTAFLPSEVKTRLSALSQQLAGKTVVFATPEELAQVNSLYEQIRVKTLGLVSIPSILLQPAVARAAVLLLIPVAAALAAAIAEALLFVIVVIAAILLVITLIDIMERLASRPKPAEPEPVTPAKPVDVPKPGPGADVIPISRHPRYEPKFPPERTFDPFLVPKPEPAPKPRPDEDTRRRPCRIDPVAPLGGDELANIYCEFATGTWAGLDYRVTTPEGQYAVFDAYAGGMLYECKCGYLSMVRAYRRGDRSDRRYWRAVAAIEGPDGLDQRSRRQEFVASTCGIPLRWYVSNVEVRDFLNERWFGSPLVLDVPWSECD